MIRAVGTGSRQAIERLVDLIVPWSCPLCGRDDPQVRTDQDTLCSICREALAPFDGNSCAVCAAPLPDVPQARCAYCRQRHYRFEAAVALGLYRAAIRQAVLRMKYGFHEPLTLAVGQRLWERIDAAGWRSQLDLVTAVPLGLWKRLRRGASAPELLAEVIGRRAKMPVVPHLLRLRRTTRKQGTLLPNERFLNVRDAFEVSSCYDITNARVLLVDDVLTTGATAGEVAKVLLAAGAAAVRVATVARGTGN